MIDPSKLPLFSDNFTRWVFVGGLAAIAAASGAIGFFFASML